MLALEGVSRVYGSGVSQVQALRDFSLAFPPGSVAVIVGPSGSGKTTLLNLVGGIDRPTSGRIVLGGVEVSALDQHELLEYRRERVGFVFQFFNLIPSLTAVENVALAADLVKGPASPAQLLADVGLGDRMDHFPSQLSGGEQQRVSIARALVKKPPLLLCDEPTGELDYATGVRVLELLQGAAKRSHQTVIIVTHNTAIAEAADMVVRLRGGQIDGVDRNESPAEASSLRW